MKRSISQREAARTLEDDRSVRGWTAAWMMLLSLLALAVAGPALAQNAPATQAGNAIQSVTATIAQGGNVLVRITLKEAPSAAPNGFQISNPSRLSFDFPNTANGTGKNTQEVAQGDLRSVNLVQVADRTRLVLNMTRTVPYETRVEGNSLIVALQGAGGSAAVARRTGLFEPADGCGAASSCCPIGAGVLQCSGVTSSSRSLLSRRPSLILR